MGIGLGILLVIVGLVLMFAVNVNIPYVSDNTLGLILLIGGVLAIVLAVVMNAQRSRTKHVQENRYDGPPPAA